MSVSATTSSWASNVMPHTLNLSERKHSSFSHSFWSVRFKQKSLATHPTRNPNDLTVNTIKFRDICEAFDVLSQGKWHDLTVSNFYLWQIVELRAIYDKHGEYGLKEGIVMEGKRVGGGYFLKCQPE